MYHIGLPRLTALSILRYEDSSIQFSISYIQQGLTSVKKKRARGYVKSVALGRLNNESLFKFLIVFRCFKVRMVKFVIL